MMKHVYGPVPSRRLGRSLGIDPIPMKTCDWNCVYCQLGRTKHLTLNRQEYIPAGTILDEVREALSRHEPGQIDWLTFVGSGEPTLHSRLGWLMRQVRRSTDLPIAVITNGSLLHRPEVRRELAIADAVLPTFDAGSERLYHRINRAHPKLTHAQLLRGLIAFRHEYRERLWVEVMLVQGLNDTEESLAETAQALELIEPDEIHLNVPVRPPSETWVRPPTLENLQLAAEILGEKAGIVHVDQGSFDLGSRETALDAAIDIITRHPMRQSELLAALREQASGQETDVLAALETSGRVQTVQRSGTRFWCSADTRHSDKDRKRPRSRSEKHPQAEDQEHPCDEGPDVQQVGA